MVDIVLVEKTGELKISKYVDGKDELYKKCKFKKADNFDFLHAWTSKNGKYSFKTVSLYARNTGNANTENKYDFPPPVDNLLNFGCCCLVARNEMGDYVDLSVEDWNKFYEELFGGFENLADTAKEDENEEDELENIPAELKTKTGYLKDGFVVDDTITDSTNNNSSNTSNKDSCEEDIWEEDDTSELEFESYVYSDED